MQKILNNKALLIIITPIAMSVAWYVPAGFIGLWIGLALLLQLEKNLLTQKFRLAKLWAYTYLIFLIWNTLTTWWVKNATFAGATAMILANSLLMTLPLLFFFSIKNQLPEKLAIWVLPFLWITFEYAHLNWELSWTWLNFGNAFAYSHWAVQWYEYTGSLGGTLWSWVAGIALWKYLQKPQSIKYQRSTVLVCTIPLLFSLILYFTHQEKGKPVEITVIQPNIDPYTEKFIGTEHFISYEKQAEILIDLARTQITPYTQLLLFPETAFDEGYDEKQILQYAPIQKLMKFLQQNPQLSILGGTTTWLIYGKEKATQTARYSPKIGFYDVFNTAMFLQSKADSVAFYHKSKLVPLVESMPYAAIIEKILGKLIIELGGTSGSLGFQKEAEVFFSDSLGFAPIICYESIFGEYVTEYVRKGAHILCIITNDGWWGDTPGYHQHWQMARLRAIETRRSVARSANTGISGFFNQRGDAITQTAFWVRDVRRQSIQANTTVTFYVQWGDYIGKIAVMISAIVTILLLIKWLKSFFVKTSHKRSFCERL